MNNFVDWLVKDRIVLTSIIGELHVENFPMVDRSIIHFFEASPWDKVHVISDISMMTSMPNIFQMTKLRYITHPKIGFFVTQSRNPAEEFIGNTVGRVLKTQYKFVRTLDEGIEFLSWVDPNLPPVEDIQARAHMLLESFRNGVTP